MPTPLGLKRQLNHPPKDKEQEAADRHPPRDMTDRHDYNLATRGTPRIPRT